MNKYNAPFYIQILSTELEKRKERNSRYSMRAFANALGLDPSALSRILSGKQELSLQSCLKVLKKVQLTEEEKKLFLSSVAEDKMHRAYTILSRSLDSSSSTLVNSQPIENPVSLASQSHKMELPSVDPGVTLIIDKKGKILYANEIGAQSLGMQSFEIVGKSVTSLGLPAEAVSLMEKKRDQVFREGLPITVEVKLSTDQGIKRYQRTLTPLFSEDGIVNAVLSGLREIGNGKYTEERLQLLIEVGKLLDISLDYKATLKNVSRLAVSKFADWCIIHILEENGEVHRIEVAHWDSSQEKELNDFISRITPQHNSEIGFPAVLKSGKAQLLSTIDDAVFEGASTNEVDFFHLKKFGLKSTICVPMRIKSKILGSMTLTSAHASRIYDSDDLAFAEELGSRIAHVIYTAFLHTTIQTLSSNKTVPEIGVEALV